MITIFLSFALEMIDVQLRFSDSEFIRIYNFSIP
jgi:hypothetical protein